MAPRQAQPDAGTPNVPTYQYQTPAPATGPAFEVSRDDVLAKRNALLAEAEDFQRLLLNIREDLAMEPCGDDPVSHDVAQAVSHRLAGPASDSYWNVCQQWVDNLFKAADALAETARDYGYTDAEIAESFNRGGQSA
jgi:hypothetical protein